MEPMINNRPGGNVAQIAARVANRLDFGRPESLF
jgi:hypothetical protein